MSILLVYPAALLLVALIVVVARRTVPRPTTARTGRPLRRTVGFIVGVLIVAPIMTLAGFAGVAKRMS